MNGFTAVLIAAILGIEVLAYIFIIDKFGDNIARWISDKFVPIDHEKKEDASTL